MRDLLKDTITLMCKNGLKYDTEFSVEALIGITLDQENVFLISLNEKIVNPTTAVTSTEKDSAASIRSVVREDRKRKRADSTCENDPLLLSVDRVEDGDSHDNSVDDTSCDMVSVLATKHQRLDSMEESDRDGTEQSELNTITTTVEQKEELDEPDILIIKDEPGITRDNEFTEDITNPAEDSYLSELIQSDHVLSKALMQPVVMQMSEQDLSLPGNMRDTYTSGIAGETQDPQQHSLVGIHCRKLHVLEN